ncbi:unnamed protein product [Alternaria alternata]
MDVLAAIYFLARVRFAPGIWAQLRSPSPPTIAFFKSLPQHIPRNVWGIYIVVLEMDGASPQIYIGSGTAFKGDVLYRTRSYWKRKNLPKNVKKFCGGGYYIGLYSSRKFRDTLPRWYSLGLAVFVGDVGSDVYLLARFYL